MSESNFRLAEHNVEMTIVTEGLATDQHVSFTADDDSGASYTMSLDKWSAAGEPKMIYITVTAVLPTDEPADEVEVFRSAKTGEFVSEEFAERNPSTTMKHSYDNRQFED